MAFLDMTFWVRDDPEHPGYHVCTEVETGCSAWGPTSQEAVENYFAGNIERPPVVDA